MARKKVPTPARKQEEVEPRAKPYSFTGDHSPPSSASDKVEHLKTLNNLLLKETMERREQVSHLNSVVSGLSADHDFLSAIERDISGIVLSSRLAEARDAAARKMEMDLYSLATHKAESEERARSLQATMDSRSVALRSAEGRLEMVIREKDEMKKELDRSLLDLDLKSVEADDLRAMVRNMEEERDELAQQRVYMEGRLYEHQKLIENLGTKLEESDRSKKEVVEYLMAEREADAAKISALQEEHRGAALSKGRLESELVRSKDAFDSLKRVEEGLRSEVVALGERTVELLGGLERLRVDFGALKIEKEEGEMRFEDQTKETTQQFDDLRLRMGEITAQKDESERTRGVQEVQIAGLQKMVEELQSCVSDLERVCKNQVEANAQLKADSDAATRDLDLERGEAKGLRLQFGELQKSKDRIEEELERLRVDLALLKKEKEEGEESFESQMRGSARQLDELKDIIADITAQKDEIERARSVQEVEITGLQRVVEQLHSSVSELEGVRKDQAEANALLKAANDGATRDLDLERGEAEGLRIQFGELQKSKDGVEDELERLRVDLALLKKEKEECQESFESQMRELEQQLDELRESIGKITAQKNEIERARSVQEVEITGLQSTISELEVEVSGLQKMVEMLHTTVSKLEGECRDHAESNAQLRADMDAAWRTLDAEKEEAGRLVRLVDNLAAEGEGRKRQLSSLTEKKDSLERSLNTAHHELEDAKRKMKAAEKKSERALSCLRTTAGVVLDTGASQENGVEKEAGDVAEMDKEMQPFASELEAMRAAFVGRAGEIEDLNREVGLLKGALAEAEKKKKGGLWAWLYPATTTAAIAAISIACAAKGH